MFPHSMVWQLAKAEHVEEVDGKVGDDVICVLD
jgi:hypothetical protein